MSPKKIINVNGKKYNIAAVYAMGQKTRNINGQRSCYWDYSKENENPELT